MTTYRVVINTMHAVYRERWQADSPQDAIRKARARWQREFGDAAAYHFSAHEIHPTRWSDEDGEGDS